MSKVEEKHEITLKLLSAVEVSSHITQRSVASELGIALGLVNTYLKRCVKKGLIKIRQVPANRYAYYLTPEGFSEKARLTTEYLTQGFQLFRLSRNQLLEILKKCESLKHKKIILYGLSDIAEIAVLCAQEFDLEIVGIIDGNSPVKKYSNINILKKLDKGLNFDSVVVTDTNDPVEKVKYLEGVVESSRIFTPDILKVAANYDQQVGKTWS